MKNLKYVEIITNQKSAFICNNNEIVSELEKRGYNINTHSRKLLNFKFDDYIQYMKDVDINFSEKYARAMQLIRFDLGGNSGNPTILIYCQKTRLKHIKQEEALKSKLTLLAERLNSYFSKISDFKVYEARDRINGGFKFMSYTCSVTGDLITYPFHEITFNSEGEDFCIEEVFNFMQKNVEEKLTWQRKLEEDTDGSDQAMLEHRLLV